MGIFTRTIRSIFPKADGKICKLNMNYTAMGISSKPLSLIIKRPDLTILLDAAQKLADLLLRTFLGAGAWATPGHEEIEIALIRLAQATNNPAYLDLAEQFLERRGRKGLFGLSILLENIRVNQRTKQRDEQRAVLRSNTSQSDQTIQSS